MTREEKIEATNKKCDSYVTCKDCPLCGSCIIDVKGASDYEIDKEYARFCGEEPKPDMVNQPPHYKHGMECIDEMIQLFGREATMNFCLLNAWKYRKRAIHKNGQEDMDKSDWYIAKYVELKKEGVMDESK